MGFVNFYVSQSLQVVSLQVTSRSEERARNDLENVYEKESYIKATFGR